MCVSNPAFTTQTPTFPDCDWQNPFTHMPTIKHFKYLSVCVYTFCGWDEVYPTSNKTASIATTLLASNIVSHFVLSTFLQ